LLNNKKLPSFNARIDFIKEKSSCQVFDNINLKKCKITFSLKVKKDFTILPVGLRTLKNS